MRGLLTLPSLILHIFHLFSISYLDHLHNGQILGPFPAGKYSVSLMTSATAGRPDKKLIPLSIEKDKTDELDFVFAPDGLASGCVTTSQETISSPGMPEYVYRSGKRKIIIESISLTGNGIARSPQPVRGKYYNDNSYLPLYSDYCYNECFAFFGLPAGEYSLSIKARGYMSVKRNFSIISGIPKLFQNIELVSEESGKSKPVLPKKSKFR